MCGRRIDVRKRCLSHELKCAASIHITILLRCVGVHIHDRLCPQCVGRLAAQSCWHMYAMPCLAYGGSSEGEISRKLPSRAPCYLSGNRNFPKSQSCSKHSRCKYPSRVSPVPPCKRTTRSRLCAETQCREGMCCTASKLNDRRVVVRQLGS